MTEKPTLNVLQGGWVSSPDWLDFPAALAARSPYNEAAHCAFRVSRDDQFKRATNRRRQPAFDFWSVLAGKVPPVPGLVGSSDGLMTLVDAHACFIGLKRPLAEDQGGDNIVAYILKPKHFYARTSARRVWLNERGSRMTFYSSPTSGLTSPSR